jgi:hypothetical protein
MGALRSGESGNKSDRRGNFHCWRLTVVLQNYGDISCDRILTLIKRPTIAESVLGYDGGGESSVMGPGSPLTIC